MILIVTRAVRVAATHTTPVVIPMGAAFAVTLFVYAIALVVFKALTECGSD